MHGCMYANAGFAIRPQTLAHMCKFTHAYIHRYQFYTTGWNEGRDTVQAAGKAIAHAALRLWWFAEISGHRFGILYALFNIPYER